ncbi:hypothetical protein OG369_25300 [Streptomyces sp. NBC_01221]|uniref:hypothetical protein n=1 Tax=unclassified Streptomyces TaxID=2593676 RepID=UPI0022517A59|nr:hypothetical protein [Streptomyces sp. NBC_01221]MCX4789377.1 hypothetical protein [Streptomyces sp. NBC_01221]WSP57520.1 hypothetical protein OG306_26420 [Streptomyces sp. NBC_01241]
MNSSSEIAADEQPARHRRLPVAVDIALVFVACVAAAIGVVACVADDVSSDLSDQEMNCCWKEGATPAWMSGQMGIRIPETASDRRAGYKVGQRYDTGLLSFVLPSEEAEANTGRLVREGTKMIGNFHPEKKEYRPAAAFAHLGLAEPETFVQGLRKTSLCPDELDSPEGKYLQRCIDLFVHEFRPGTTRIYVRSTIEPTVTPPPASPGPRSVLTQVQRVTAMGKAAEPNSSAALW